MFLFLTTRCHPSRNTSRFGADGGTDHLNSGLCVTARSTITKEPLCLTSRLTKDRHPAVWRRLTAELVFPGSQSVMMRSRAHSMHLDFITGGWKPALLSFSLSAEGKKEDSHRIHHWLCFWGLAFHLTLVFPFLLFKQLQLCVHSDLWSAVYSCTNPHVWHTCRDRSADWCAHQCFNFKSALLGCYPPSSPPTLSLCWESFFFLSPLPRWCAGKLLSLPVSPPGQSAPSHMPCRLARSSASLNRLIAAPSRLPSCRLLPCAETRSTSKERIHLPPPPPHPNQATNPWCTPPPPPPPPCPAWLSLPIVNFADEIKQTNFHRCVRSGAPDRVRKRKKKKINAAPKCEIKLNM